MYVGGGCSEDGPASPETMRVHRLSLSLLWFSSSIWSEAERYRMLSLVPVALDELSSMQALTTVVADANATLLDSRGWRAPPLHAPPLPSPLRNPAACSSELRRPRCHCVVSGASTSCHQATQYHRQGLRTSFAGRPHTPECE